MRTRNPRMVTATASLATMVGRRHVKPWCWPAGLVLFLTATSVSAQQPGDTVRVSGELVGVIVEADSAGLLLFSGYAPYAEMRSLEVWGGIRGQAGRGFMYGSIVGGTLGVLGGVLVCYVYGCIDLGDYATVSLMLGAPAGAAAGVIGALVGATVKSDIWEPVLIPGGLALRVTVGGRSPH